MSVSDDKPVQAQILESELRELGYDQILQEVEEELNPDPEMMDDVMMYGTAVAMGEKLEEHDFNYTETGGWAVFSHLFKQHGIEAFQNWRGSDDSDKNIQANTGPEYDTIKDVLEDPKTGYGPHNSKTTTASLSTTENHEEGQKYTVKLEVAERDLVKHDILVNETPSQESYNFNNLETVQIGNGQLKIPALEEVISAKLQSYYNKSTRSRDKTDIAALLSVAEEKSETDSFYNGENLYQEIGSFSHDGFEDFENDGSYSHQGEFLKTVVNEIRHEMPQLQSEDHYLPSQEYLNSIK